MLTNETNLDMILDRRRKHFQHERSRIGYKDRGKQESTIKLEEKQEETTINIDNDIDNDIDNENEIQREIMFRTKDLFRRRKPGNTAEARYNAHA